MTITTRLYTLFFGRLAGTDSFGNRYYARNNKRWVVYRRAAEPTMVTPEWHGWLHHTADTPLTSPAQTWEKPPTPNRTGTIGAYAPAGHLLRGARHAPTTAEYEPWTPS